MSHLTIVLVQTQGPANLGAIARCAAAFGVDDLRLVDPQCEIDETTLMWACYGSRVLDGIQRFDDLPSALTDCGVSVALTRRDGKRRHRHSSLSQFCEEVYPNYRESGKLALVFGNEESGLANHHLAACQFSAEIPVVATDGSLNLSHAVGITLYEVAGRPRQLEQSEPTEHERPAGEERLQALMEASRKTLAMAGYPHHRSNLEDELTKLKDIVMRSQLEEWEVRLLLGMLKQTRHRFSHPEKFV